MCLDNRWKPEKSFTLKFAAKLLLMVEIFAVFKFLRNPPCYVVVAIALLSSPVFPGARWHDGARHAQLLFSSVSRKAKRKLAVWLAIDLKCYYDEILMSCVSRRIIYSSSLRKTVTLNLIEMKIFTPPTGKNWAWKVVFSRPPLWIYVSMSLRYRAAATRYWPIVFLSWRHFLNSHWSFLT